MGVKINDGLDFQNILEDMMIHLSTSVCKVMALFLEFLRAEYSCIFFNKNKCKENLVISGINNDIW